MGGRNPRREETPSPRPAGWGLRTEEPLEFQGRQEGRVVTQGRELRGPQERARNGRSLPNPGEGSGSCGGSAPAFLLKIVLAAVHELAWEGAVHSGGQSREAEEPRAGVCARPAGCQHPSRPAAQIQATALGHRGCLPSCPQAAHLPTSLAALEHDPNSLTFHHTH